MWYGVWISSVFIPHETPPPKNTDFSRHMVTEVIQSLFLCGIPVAVTEAR